MADSQVFFKFAPWSLSVFLFLCQYLN